MEFAKCTNEEPCGNCDICDMEPGDDICGHGEHYMLCEICTPPEVAPACKHHVVGECEKCDDEYEARLEAECDTGDYCMHDMPSDECMECGAALDESYQRGLESAEWRHFHDE